VHFKTATSHRSALHFLTGVYKPPSPFAGASAASLRRHRVNDIPSHSGPGLWWVAAGTFGALAAGSMLRLVALRRATRDVAKQRLDSLKTWWILASIVIAGALLGPVASTILVAATSVVAWREFERLTGEQSAGWRLRFVAYGLILLSYLCIWLGQAVLYFVFLPWMWFLLSSFSLVVSGQTEGYVRIVSRCGFGIFVTAYFLGYAPLLFTLPAETQPRVGVVGWFLFLVLVTAWGDIAQALMGRAIGKRKITPVVSPHKTWEGFIGGTALTILAAAGLAPWLTTLDHAQAAVAGVVIALAGFVGDLNMSAIKRDAGVKDSSRLLPGQGGILDRIDSLTYSAPAFYFFVRAAVG